MDELEARRIEKQIRDEAAVIALALADHPEFAIDLRDELGRSVGETLTRDELDDLYAIGGADDAQRDHDSPEFRRIRRLGELKLALDDVRGAQWPNA